MKTLWVSLLIGMIFFLGGCMENQFEKLEPHSDQDELVKRAKEESGSLLTIPSHHGFYVNDFYTADPLTTILGNPAKETELLQWAATHEFNSISLYRIRNILLTQDPILIGMLGEFVGRAKNDFGLEVIFSAGGLDGITRIQNYCADNANNVDALPTGVVTEYEFWHAGGNSTPNSFSVYLQMLDILEDMIDTYNFERSFLYIFRFEDHGFNGIVGTHGNGPGGDGSESQIGYCPSDVMEKILKKIRDVGEDKLYISYVNYRDEAYIFPMNVNIFYTGLQQLATMASAPANPANGSQHTFCEYDARLDMYVNIVFIFNVKYSSGAPNIFYYFDQNDMDMEFEKAYDSFEDGFNSSPITNKDRLQFQGSQIYRYTEAKEARPN